MIIFQCFMTRFKTPEESKAQLEKMTLSDQTSADPRDYPEWIIPILTSMKMKRDDNNIFTVKLADEVEALTMVNWFRKELMPWAKVQCKEDADLLYCSASDGGVDVDERRLESF